MQSIINQVVGVLREEGASQYEITLAELSEIITARVAPLARETGVQFSTEHNGEAILPNRAANLVTLILINLVQTLSRQRRLARGFASPSPEPKISLSAKCTTKERVCLNRLDKIRSLPANPPKKTELASDWPLANNWRTILGPN